MQKKGLWLFAILLIAVIITIFYLKDNRDMDLVEKEQLESAEDSADSKLDLLNEGFENLDLDESEIEDASLAYDTIQ
jgi:preprotein translocase subunit SecF